MAQTIEAIFYQGPDARRDYTPSGAVSAGAVREREDGQAGVATTDIAASELGSEHIRGVFKVKKADGKAFSKGDPVYWDADGDTSLTADDTIAVADFYLGVADADAASGDDYVLVDLNQQSPDLAGTSS